MINILHTKAIQITENIVNGQLMRNMDYNVACVTYSTRLRVTPL